jgi:hypothetical protein
MRPVRHNLKAIQAKPNTDDKEKVSEYGRALIINIKTVGNHIEQKTSELPQSSREKRRKHLWYYSQIAKLISGVLYAIFGPRTSPTNAFKGCMRMFLRARRKRQLQLQLLKVDSKLESWWTRRCDWHLGFGGHGRWFWGVLLSRI